MDRVRAELEDWNNGWFGIGIALEASEIDRLIALLQSLKADPDQHFHISSDYSAAGGIGDIEVYVKSPGVPDNLFLSSTALAPGDSV